MNRRDFLANSAAAAAALAVVRAAANAAPAAPKRAPEGPPRDPRAPSEREVHNRLYMLVLIALYEVQEALEACQGLDLEGGVDAQEDVEGILYHFRMYIPLVEGESYCVHEAEAEHARRTPEADPVYRVSHALKALREAAAEALADSHVPELLQEDCAGIAWGVGIWHDLWECSAPSLMTEENRRKRLALLLADHEARKRRQARGD